jgi:hypothetical protein
MSLPYYTLYIQTDHLVTIEPDREEKAIVKIRLTLPELQRLQGDLGDMIHDVLAKRLMPRGDK